MQSEPTDSSPSATDAAPATPGAASWLAKRARRAAHVLPRGVRGRQARRREPGADDLGHAPRAARRGAGVDARELATNERATRSPTTTPRRSSARCARSTGLGAHRHRGPHRRRRAGRQVDGRARRLGAGATGSAAGVQGAHRRGRLGAGRRRRADRLADRRTIVDQGGLADRVDGALRGESTGLPPDVDVIIETTARETANENGAAMLIREEDRSDRADHRPDAAPRRRDLGHGLGGDRRPVRGRRCSASGRARSPSPATTTRSSSSRASNPVVPASTTCASTARSLAPGPTAAMPPSVIRTLGDERRPPLRLLFGSCRAPRRTSRRGRWSWPRLGPRAAASMRCAARACGCPGSAATSWPDLLVLLGDQVYADDSVAEGP